MSEVTLSSRADEPGIRTQIRVRFAPVAPSKIEPDYRDYIVLLKPRVLTLVVFTGADRVTGRARLLEPDNCIYRDPLHNDRCWGVWCH